MPRGDSYLLQLQQGGIVLTGQSSEAVVGPFRAIVAIEDSELDAVLGNFEPGLAFDGKTLQAGQSLLMRISSFFLNGGTVIAYYA